MARLSSIMLVCFMLTSSAWAENWAHWRGPMSTGATKGAPPTQFSNTQNVKWKVAIPGAGSGSPVVWENRVFVVTSIADTKNDGSFSFEVHCYDRTNGKQLWKQTAVQATPHQATPQHQYTCLGVAMHRRSACLCPFRLARAVLLHGGWSVEMEARLRRHEYPQQFR